MALIRCPHALLWVYTKGTLSLLRRNRTSSRSFVHTRYMTREPTHFWREKGHNLGKIHFNNNNNKITEH